MASNQGTTEGGQRIFSRLIGSPGKFCDVNWEFMGENVPPGLEVEKGVKGKLKGSYRDDCPVAEFT